MPTISKQVVFPPELIDSDADRVVRQLAQRGHEAFLVGGCVRDLLLKRTPKDFDVATSATPNEIRQIFRNCRIIGRRFRLAHIFFGTKIIETSTFRANPRAQLEGEDELLIRRDNVFGSPTEDALRRDFTINGLFYDPKAEQVIDHVGGLIDLESRIVRTIGDPDIRFREDPVRMLRAIKFAARLEFDIETQTYQALIRHHNEVRKCASARILEELYRLLRSGAAFRSMRHLVDTGVADVLSAQLAGFFSTQEADSPTSDNPRQNLTNEHLTDEQVWEQTWREDAKTDRRAPLDSLFADRPRALAERRVFAWQLLKQLDHFVRDGQQLTNTLLLATLAVPFVLEDMLKPGTKSSEASALIDQVLHPLVIGLRIARRDAERARHVLLAQRRMAPSHRRRGRPMTLMSRDYFQDAVNIFAMTRIITGASEEEIGRWKQLQPVDAESCGNGTLQATGSNRRRRRGGRRRRRLRSDDTTDVKLPLD